MKVAKFGGTSLASAEQFRKVGRIVASDRQRRIIVVSAPGKRHKADTKVTDMLIACADRHLAFGSAEAEVRAVAGRYAEIAAGLGLPDTIAQVVADDLKARLAGDKTHRARFVDTLKAAGEDNCAKLFAQYLASIGVPAAYVSPKEAGLLVSAEFGNAQVLPESYERLKALRGRREVVVFPGFFGYSKAGDVVTFPRGGSDITGSIVAAGVKAELYENFTDVDSVFVASPGIIHRPCAIVEITYREMRELSYAGFSVFHEEALEPAVRARIPVCIRNTNNPSAPGTMIVPERTGSHLHLALGGEVRNEDVTPGAVTGIACDAGFCSIYLSKYLMNREVGFGRRLLQILEDERLSFEHCPTGIDNFSVILREKLFDAAKEARILERIRIELKVDDVSVERNLALVMLVGEGMRHTVGIAARATAALARAGVNIEMINQGSSEVSMMFGVKAPDAHNAVRTLYHEFFVEPTAS